MNRVGHVAPEGVEAEPPHAGIDRFGPGHHHGHNVDVADARHPQRTPGHAVGVVVGETRRPGSARCGRCTAMTARRSRRPSSHRRRLLRRRRLPRGRPRRSPRWCDRRRDLHRARCTGPPSRGPPATAMTRAPAALPSWMPAVPRPLAPEWTTSVSPAWSRPRLNRARCDVWNVSKNAVASASSKPGGASNTEMVSAIAYSAMPPSAFLVMATTALAQPGFGARPDGVDHAADVHSQREGRRCGHGDQVAPATVDVVEVQGSRVYRHPDLVRAGLGALDRAHREHLSGRAVLGDLYRSHVCHAPSLDPRPGSFSRWRLRSPGAQRGYLPRGVATLPRRRAAARRSAVLSRRGN